MTKPSSTRKRGAVPVPASDAAVAAWPARTRLVVGIGASAGGIEAFKAFFSKMPGDTGMTFVLVQHLDPKYESSLAAIVAGYTPMPVSLVEDGMRTVSNHIYIIPPDAILTMKGGALHLDRPASPLARRTSINAFLTSLAEDQRENAIGIILSGFGSDGALGIAAIKEHGGLTLSQAEFDHYAKSGMPQSATSGGFVDHVLSVEDMPAALLEYRHHRAIHDTTKGLDGIHEDLPSNLATICAVLHSRLGRNFSEYKPGTLTRRIQRRMLVLQTDDVSFYIEKLRTMPEEAELLFREILIGVTRFFRDQQAFEALEAAIIPILFADKDSTEPIRVWVAGCATGEEAYSVAMILKEAATRSTCRRPIQVLATDIDDRAIDAARAGLYPGTIASDLSAERLGKHFLKDDGNYRVTKSLREMCLFSTHDLASDPPFSRLDLISCRNMMIYFDLRLQNRILANFHYALRPEGHLFLGLSEGVTAQPRLFEPLDKRHRLFVRRAAPAQLPAFAISRIPEFPSSVKHAVSVAGDDIDRRAARVMSRYAPAYLVVDGRYDILRFSGDTAKYIQPVTGIASLQLFSLLHADLRAPVRAAIKNVAATGERVLFGSVDIRAAGQQEAVSLIVEPLPGPGTEVLFVVAFRDVQTARASLDAGGRDDDHSSAAEASRELLQTKEQLRNVTEEMQAAFEELQSSNEEYLSVNEELQSANEELETSKEELQSLNEELQTINAELNHRNENLVRSNSDLTNLFESTSIATLFLDNDLRIRRFTPRLRDIFSVRDGDQGRPIGDIVSRLTRGWLGHDVLEVLRSLIPVEREVAVAEAGVSYLMQIRPYRDLNNVIDGAVVTFVDISERKKHEQAQSLLAAIVESSQDAIISHDLHGVITSWNAGAERLYRRPASEAIGKSISTLLNGIVPADWRDLLARIDEGERVAHFEATKSIDGSPGREVSVTISPVREGDGRIAGASVVARDVSERKAAEQKASLLLGELDHRVKNILAIVSAVVSQTLRTSPAPEVFAAEVEGRVKAIATAHSLLTEAGQGSMSLRALFATELAPYDAGNGNLVVTGSDIALAPRTGLALAMAVHELASNAAKYGALSISSGCLAVTWEVTGRPYDRTLTLSWTETGGPPVQAPSRRGFGTTLIERTLSHELDAVVTREFLTAGLQCMIVLPLTDEAGVVPDDREAGSGRNGQR